MSRYECKYYITENQYEQIMRWTEPYVTADAFAAQHADHRYMLSSLYLDSHDLRIGRMTTHGLRNRFKLRIRTYNDDPASPVFFEIKRRIDGVIAKVRVKLSRESGIGLIEGRARPCDVAEGEDLHDLETFMRLMEAYCARPMMRVRYEREAYGASHGEPVRLTFDRKLAFADTRDTNFMVNGPGWRTVQTAGVIFEVKFPDFFPFWVGEMIHGLQLQRVSIPKYNLSLDGARAGKGKMLEGMFYG